MHVPHNCFTRVLSIFCISFFVGTSYAQQPVASSTASTDEIIVTARKREENALAVPIAITQFSREELANPAINDISSLGSQTPNLNFIATSPLSGSGNAASVYLRGVGQNDFLLTTDPGIGIYLDGVYIARSIGAVLELNDIDRVEVLHGPQGTLFGKNSIGGAIQLFSRKPSKETHGEIATTLGDFQRRDLDLSIEGSLSSTLQARLSIRSEKRDGYIDRLLDDVDLGDVDRTAAKAVVAWQLGDNTDITMTLDHTTQRQESIAQTAREIIDNPPGPQRAIFNAESPITYDSRWLTDNAFETYQTGLSRDDLNINGFSLTAEHSLDWADWVSVTGYRRMSAIYSRDADGSPADYGLSINTDEHTQFSQEFRLQGDAFRGQLDWLVGLYYLREHGFNRTDGRLFSNTSAAFDFTVLNDIVTRSYALFSQNIWHINPRTNMTFGLRITREKKAFSADNRLTNGAVLVDDSDGEKWRNLSPMLSLDYWWQDNLMTYASVSRGFKSGGFNGRQVFSGSLDDFDPEFLTTIEMGVKASLLEKRLYIQASVFSMQYKDLQVTTLPTAITPTIDNAAKAKIEGAELSVTYHHGSGFSATTGVGYLDARYKSLKGNTEFSIDDNLVRTPRWNAHVKPSYSWNTDKGDWELSTVISYKSKVYNDAINTESIAQGGFTTVDVSASWLSSDEHWQVQVFGVNVTDKRYIVSGSSDLNVFGGSEGHFARPRELGIKLSYLY